MAAVAGGLLVVVAASWMYHGAAMRALGDDRTPMLSAEEVRAAERYIDGSVWARPPWVTLDAERQGEIAEAALRRHADGDGEIIPLVARLAVMSERGEKFTDLGSIAGELALDGDVADPHRLLILAGASGLAEHAELASLLEQGDDATLHGTLLVILEDDHLAAHAEAALHFALRDDVHAAYRARMLDRLASMPRLFPFELNEDHRAAIKALSEDGTLPEGDRSMVESFIEMQAGGAREVQRAGGG